MKVVEMEVYRVYSVEEKSTRTAFAYTRQRTYCVYTINELRVGVVVQSRFTASKERSRW